MDVLCVQAGGHGQGFTTYAKGDRWDLAVEAWGGGRESDRRLRSPHRTRAVPHRGVRSFPVLTAPADPGQVLGCYREREVSKVRNFWYRHADAEARPWTFQYVAGRTSQSLVANPPHVTTTDPRATETVEVWWVSFCEKESNRWALANGFKLGPSRLSQRIEVAVPLPGMPSFGTAQDPVRVDSTPEPGSVEGTAAVMASLQRLPDFQARVNDRLADFAGVRDLVTAELGKQLDLLLSMARNVTAHAQVSANHAAVLTGVSAPADGIAARPLPSAPRPPPSWHEFI